MKILIIRLGAFGDIIHTLPLAHDLNKNGHKIDWLCEDRWSVLLNDNPIINKTIILPRGAWKKNKTGFFKKLKDIKTTVRKIKNQNYDFIIDAQGLLKSSVFSLFSRCHKRIGHDKNRAKEMSHLVSNIKAPSIATHVINQQKALALPILKNKIKSSWEFSLPKWEKEQEEIKKWFEVNNLNKPFAINVGAGWPTKIWPYECQLEFIKLCVSNKKQILVLWGNASELEMATKLTNEIPEAVLAPDTTLPSLASLFKLCKIVVSGDTGPLHLAFAVNTPTVGLFGPVPAERNGPYGKKSTSIQGKEKPDWNRKDVSKSCMKTISPKKVFKVCCELIK